ncbi:hypothetical protein I553_10767 [Mycobacterium xenopi 4042]|uniref:Uncharacterized protein n=1 Tax=Mycobacterium xenopi 4042 TaxID=1299334 RepID=X8DD96_MYCXE|nr:hypothetical protein I553_10767 [Mycobacterium xenopi 4042]
MLANGPSAALSDSQLVWMALRARCAVREMSAAAVSWWSVCDCAVVSWPRVFPNVWVVAVAVVRPAGPGVGR